MRSYYKRPKRVNLGLFDRLIAVASYLSAGAVGFIWLIFAHIARKNLKPFVKFHAFQSILLAFGYYVVSLVLKILLGVVEVIPFIGELVLKLVFYIAQLPLIYTYSILNFAIVVVMVYLILGAIMGRKSYIPVVSDAIERMI